MSFPQVQLNRTFGLLCSVERFGYMLARRVPVAPHTVLPKLDVTTGFSGRSPSSSFGALSRVLEVLLTTWLGSACYSPPFPATLSPHCAHGLVLLLPLCQSFYSLSSSLLHEDFVYGPLYSDCLTARESGGVGA